MQRKLPNVPGYVSGYPHFADRFDVFESRGLGLCALVPRLMRLVLEMSSSAPMLDSAPSFLETFLVIDQRIQVDDFIYVGGVGAALYRSTY